MNAAAMLFQERVDLICGAVALGSVIECQTPPIGGFSTLNHERVKLVMPE
jgi:hypothetical protein